MASAVVPVPVLAIQMMLPIVTYLAETVATFAVPFLALGMVVWWTKLVVSRAYTVRPVPIFARAIMVLTHRAFNTRACFFIPMRLVFAAMFFATVAVVTPAVIPVPVCASRIFVPTLALAPTLAPTLAMAGFSATQVVAVLAFGVVFRVVVRDVIGVLAFATGVIPCFATWVYPITLSLCILSQGVIIRYI